MTLPAHGNSISLSQIQTEFGGSNPISLSEYYAGGSYVPSGTTGEHGAIPSSSTTSLDKFHGASSIVQTNFVYGFGAHNDGNFPQINAAKYDASGNIYSCCAVVNEYGVNKLNSTGTLQWKRKLTGTGISTALFLDVDRSDNSIYVRYRYYSSPNDGLVIAKYNSSGTLQWQRVWYKNDSFIAAHRRNISVKAGYVAAAIGYQGSSGAVYLGVWNTSGTFQWGRHIPKNNYMEWAGYIFTAVDDSGNIYLSFVESVTTKGAFILKFNSSGTLQWETRLYDGSSNHMLIGGLDVDSSGNVYVSGRSASSSNTLYIVKLSSSGSLTWSRQLTITGSTLLSPSVGVAIDSAGDPYIAGQRMPGAYWDQFFVAKWNSSGTFQYGRVWGISSPSPDYDDMEFTADGSMDVLANKIVYGPSSRMYHWYDNIGETDYYYPYGCAIQVPNSNTDTGTDNLNGTTWAGTTPQIICSAPTFNDSAGGFTGVSATHTINVGTGFTEAAGGGTDAAATWTTTTSLDNI